MKTKPPRKAEWTLAAVMALAAVMLEVVIANLPAMLPLLGKWGSVATMGFAVALAFVNFWRARQAKAEADDTDQAGA